jgi:hypothetical protein
VWWPAPAASRLQLAPPVGLLARIRERVQDFSVFLDELDARQIRPRRRRNILLLAITRKRSFLNMRPAVTPGPACEV